MEKKCYKKSLFFNFDNKKKKKVIKWQILLKFLSTQDKDCLATVLEVVELGISGSKSVGKPGEPVKMKDEKELKPASMRVRDAADVLLKTILEQVNFFNAPKWNLILIGIFRILKGRLFPKHMRGSILVLVSRRDVTSQALRFLARRRNIPANRGWTFQILCHR